MPELTLSPNHGFMNVATGSVTMSPPAPALVDPDPVTKFSVPDWPIASWRAGTTTLRQSRIYPPQLGTKN
jgi:hypothetical protein